MNLYNNVIIALESPRKGATPRLQKPDEGRSVPFILICVLMESQFRHEGNEVQGETVPTVTGESETTRTNVRPSDARPGGHTSDMRPGDQQPSVLPTHL